jgi:hypothetical protein
MNATSSLVRVTSDGTTVTARVLAQASEPTDGQWNGTSDVYSSSGFDMIGGMIGFASRVGVGSVDDLTVRSWNAVTGALRRRQRPLGQRSGAARRCQRSTGRPR